jgi:rod shape-determining protein MreC
MFSLPRWWKRYGTRIMVVLVVISAAWTLRQTQSALVVELYAAITRPFQPRIAKEDWLREARFIELQERLTELENQNQELRKLLQESGAENSSETFAPIIGRSADHWWHHLLLGRGSRQGMAVGDAVMAPGGLIGRITTVTGNTSRVLLITDPTSHVGVTISRSRSQGYVRGQGSEQLVMRFFDKNPDVRPGDVVTTSAISTVFVAGLPIGLVETVNMQASPVPEATIRITAPFGRLEWVTVTPGQDPDGTTPSGAGLSPIVEDWEATNR